MQPPHPPTELGIAAPLSALRRRLRRLRWAWWLSGLAAYVAWSTFQAYVLERCPIGTVAMLVDWSVVAAIGLMLMLLLSGREDRYLVRQEASETRRARAEYATIQLDAVRVTARTVAHTLNQPLTIIGGYAELIRNTPHDAQTDADLDRILQQVDRAALLVRQLLQVTQYQVVIAPGGTPMLDLPAAPPDEQSGQGG